jgi:hypothetical protein
MTYRDDSYSQAASLPTLAEYNRNGPPLEDEASLPAGVRCPACASAGTPVEMRIGLIASEFSKQYVAVACPRCLLSGHRRCTAEERDAFLVASGNADFLEDIKRAEREREED